jgi:molybdopterin molybdotransferase
VKSALSKWGVRDVRVETGRDDPGELETRLKEMSPGADMLIITGGSSAGDFDFTRTVLEKLGMETLFWKVAVRPGTSLLFGIFAGDPKNNSVLPVFGLPGNPMAVLVCLEEFVRPALEKLQGSVPKYTSYHLDGIVENECYTNDGMQQFLFCRATQEERGFRLNIIRTGSTSMLGKIREANAMAVSEIGKGRIKPGDTISFRWLK